MPRKPSSSSLKQKAASFPSLPGVYLMKGGRGQVLYVGKARNLRQRVLNYFRAAGDGRVRVPYLLEKVSELEFLVTDNEKEALILENNLIKKHRPPYNVYFRDDKTFFSLRLDPREEFPRLAYVRKTRPDGRLYFGPYASSAAMKVALNFAQKLFPLRLCSDNVFRHRSRPCLYYQIGRCPAPCVGLVSAAKYRESVRQLVLFLRGRQSELLNSLRRQLKRESEAFEYEKAARTLSRIRAIEETIERQKISRVKATDQDVFALVRRKDEIAIQGLFLRGGRLTGGRVEFFSPTLADDREAIGSFVSQFYAGERFIPNEIVLSIPPSDPAALARYLREKKGRKISLFVPSSGEKQRLVDLALKNARLAFAQFQHRPGGINPLGETQALLRLRNLPRVVDCFDISNLGGREAVGSLVVFRDGRKSPDDYRRYRVVTLARPDDYGMMFEVMRRRYERALDRGYQPDLIVVDGGKGQLNVARRVLDELGMDYPDVVALAKSRETATGKIGDRVFLPDRKAALFLPPGSPALRFLMRVRDEAHRFAIAYHHALRKKTALTSPLDGIRGIGPVLRERLRSSFGDLSAIRRASPEELAGVKGVSPALARRICSHFRADF